MTIQTASQTPDRALDRTHQPALAEAIEAVWADMGFDGKRRVSPEEALGAITTMVNAMAGGGSRFTVRVDNSATASTDLRTNSVNITGAALYDQRLTVVEALGVTLGMAAHEAGHGRISKPMQAAVQRALKAGTLGADIGGHLISRLSNVLDDVRLERRNAVRWPAYADVADLTLWWVAQRYPTGTVSRLPAGQDEAFSMAIAATRYDRHTIWAGGPEVEAERQWWIEWAERGIADDKPKTHVTALAEAEAHMAALPANAPQPEPQPAPSPEAEDEGDEADDLDADGDERDANDDPDGRSPWGDDDEADEDGDDDEPLEADGLSGESGDDEGDQSEAGASSEDDGDEAGGWGDADGDTGSEGEAPADGDGDSEGLSDEAVYHRSEGEAEAESGAGSDGGEGEDITFGATSHEVPDDASGEASGYEQRDGLADALPAHAAEAASADDRNMDRVVQQSMDVQATQDSRERVIVTHHDGRGAHTMAATFFGLTTSRVKIEVERDARNALRAAFTSRKVQRDRRQVTNSGSKLSGRHLYRAAAGNPTFYSRRGQPSPDSLDITLLVDCSGSMAGQRLDRAAQMAATMADALVGLPRTRLQVVGHNSKYGTALYEAWDSRKGQPLGRIAGLRSDSANNDATAIAAMGLRIIRERSDRERSVLIVLSDGAPCEDEGWVRAAVETLRKQDVGVVSVAVAGGLTNTQRACYGSEWVVPWNGDWSRLAREVAVMLGRLA